MTSQDEFVTRHLVAVAHGVDESLAELQVVAHNPVQGMAMHKVIADAALRALHAELARGAETLGSEVLAVAAEADAWTDPARPPAAAARARCYCAGTGHR